MSLLIFYTFCQFNTEELKATGISGDMVRLSVGIEHIDDLIADLTSPRSSLIYQPQSAPFIKGILLYKN